MNVREILDGFKRLRVLVAGDICLDRWCWYDPRQCEPSRETGIPRIGVVRTEITPGAGGTIANNLVALGAGTVGVLGVVGFDGFGWELRRKLESLGISPDVLVISQDVSTFTYTKLINTQTGVEDRPRVDLINTEPLSESLENEVIARLEQAVADADVVLVSDQAETHAGGVVTPRVRSRINDLASERTDKVFWVDSRKRAEHFRNVLLKPNEDEAAEASTRALGAVDLPRLRDACGFRSLIVTRGDRGAEVFNDTGSHRVHGRKVTPVDICGAGDSFSAGASCAMALTGSDITAARFGNLIASITVTKKGTGTASPAEVLAAAREYSP
jgi:rfaE bifunctional protein kinase chain/domain